MAIVNWFKRTTFEGKILRNLGVVNGEKGRIDIQELEPKTLGNSRRFRLNLVHTSPISYQSMPIVMGQDDVEHLVTIIKEALANPMSIRDRE